MKLSKLFTRTSKTSLSDSDSLNADLLTRGGYIHKTIAGSYSFLPLGLRVLRKIEQIVREEMDAVGGQEVLMSTLASKEAWQATGRWDTLDVLFRVPAHGSTEYALCPTQEEVVSPIAKTYVKSYKDLPFAAYHIQTKFRNEPRAKSGVMRGREFIMKDLYSFHATEADLDAYYDQVAEAYIRVFERLGLGEKTYFTYASGGSFSKYSHEFQTVLPSGEDTIYISKEAAKDGKRVAVNKEIFEPGMVCPATGRATEWEEVAASEVGNIFKLMTKFSAPFDLHYLDSDGKVQPVLMGCYGIGVSRLLGVVTEFFGTEKGINFPKSIAPFALELITFGKDQSIAAEGQALYEKLTQMGKEVVYDDREAAGFGEKMADSDLLGAPIRLILSEKSKEKGGIEVKNVMKGEVEIVKMEELPAHLSKLGA